MIVARDRIALSAFVAGSILAGGNSVAVRFSNRELAPIWGAAVRFSLSAVLLLSVVAAMRLEFPRGRALAGAAVYGVINFGVTFGLAYYALVRIEAGFGQTLLALVPLATLFLAVLQGQERLRAVSVVGSILALSGVAVMSGPSLGKAIPWLSLLAVMGSVTAFAEGAVLVRRLPRMHPVTMNAVGMTAAAATLLLASFATGEPHSIPHRIATWAAIAYLVPIGSVAVFILYLIMLRYWEASRAAYEFVLIPFVTVGVSAWLLHERFGWEFVAGGLLVLAGVYVGALRPAHRATRAQA